MKFAHVDEFAHCSVWLFGIEELLHRVLVAEVSIVKVKIWLSFKMSDTLAEVNR